VINSALLGVYLYSSNSHRVFFYNIWKESDSAYKISTFWLWLYSLYRLRCILSSYLHFSVYSYFSTKLHCW